MADTEVEVKMTDEEVHALTSDELIEMVGNNENIPYEQMTDEQLDLMEGELVYLNFELYPNCKKKIIFVATIFVYKSLLFSSGMFRHYEQFLKKY